MNKDYYWGWLYEEDKEPKLFFGDPDRYDFEKYEKIVHPTEISAHKLIEWLKSEASNANRHNMVDGYERLFGILQSSLHKDNVKIILRKIIEAGGIHDY